MFSTKCPKCENKIKKDYKFCPYCNTNLNSRYDQDDYGFLGKNDLADDTGFADTFMDKMFNSAMKMLEKQMRNFQNEMNNSKNNDNRYNNRNNHTGLNVQFFVNGEKVFPEKQRASHNQPLVKINNHVPKEKLRKFSELPKKEPKSRIKRLSGKIIYELFVPGVETIEDVLINQLENSIEIKALSKDKVYSKNLNINLPILRYQLVDDNLIIEMQGR